MDTGHRFNVKKVLEASALPGISKMKDASEDNIPEVVQGHITYPVVNSDPKIHRNSLAQLTREALPRLDHYRNCVEATRRPSLGELYGDPSGAKVRPVHTGRNQGTRGNKPSAPSYSLSSHFKFRFLFKARGVSRLRNVTIVGFYHLLFS
jgi:hypothetical protein